MKTNTPHNAFSLVEVSLALGVAAFCLVAVFGLLPTGLNTNRASIEQTAATNLQTAIAADLRTVPNPPPGGTAQSSAEFGIRIPASGDGAASSTIFVAENGQAVKVASDARYLVSISITPPAAGSKQATLVHLLLTWPPTASIANTTGSVESVIALDRN